MSMISILAENIESLLHSKSLNDLQMVYASLGNFLDEIDDIRSNAMEVYQDGHLNACNLFGTLGHLEALAQKLREFEK